MELPGSAWRGARTPPARRAGIGAFGVVTREPKPRSASGAVISHTNNDGHLGRCWLSGREGDAANAIVAAVGYNFRIALAWLMSFLRLVLPALIQAIAAPSPLKPAC